MATRNSRQPFNSVRYVNIHRALPGILRYYLPREDRPAFDDFGEEDEEQQSVCNVVAGCFSALTRHRAAA